jgi:hypothetical protein
MADSSNRTDDQATSSPGGVEVNKASIEVLPDNPERLGSYWSTSSTATFSLGLGEAAVVGQGIVVSATCPWNGLIGTVVWSGSVFAIASEKAELAVVEL